MRVGYTLADPCEPPNSSTVFPAVVVVPEFEIVFGRGAMIKGLAIQYKRPLGTVVEGRP